MGIYLRAWGFVCYCVYSTFGEDIVVCFVEIIDHDIESISN